MKIFQDPNGEMLSIKETKAQEVLKYLRKIDPVAFLEAIKLITENQHGFRNNRSCLTNLLERFFFQ